MNAGAYFKLRLHKEDNSMKAKHMALMCGNQPETTTAFDDTLEHFLACELDGLEDLGQSQELWQEIRQNPILQKKYDAFVLALRMLSGTLQAVDPEFESMWPMLLGRVQQDALNRSGMSKEALKHIAVPQLVASITQALYSMTERIAKSEPVVCDLPVDACEPQQLSFSITSIAGELSLRLYQNDNIDVRCQLANDELKSNVDPQDIRGWEQIDKMLTQLSDASSKLLGEEGLMNGYISIKDGRAQVHVHPMAILTTQTK